MSAFVGAILRIEATKQNNKPAGILKTNQTKTAKSDRILQKLSSNDMRISEIPRIKRQRNKVRTIGQVEKNLNPEINDQMSYQRILRSIYRDQPNASTEKLKSTSFEHMAPRVLCT